MHERIHMRFESNYVSKVILFAVMFCLLVHANNSSDNITTQIALNCATYNGKYMPCTVLLRFFSENEQRSNFLLKWKKSAIKNVKPVASA